MECTQSSSDIIQTLWVGPPTKFLHLMVNSFLAHGHTVHLYCYENLNTNAKEKNANDIIQIDQVFTKGFKGTTVGYSPFSNLFRYKLLLERGGYWVDADTICLIKWPFKSKEVFSSERGGKPNVGVIKTDDRLFLEDLYQSAIEVSKNKVMWGETGPKLFTKKLIEHNKMDSVRDPDYFCQVHYTEIDDFVDPKIDLSVGLDGYSIHLWNEIFKRRGISTEEFPKNCWLDRMCKKYGVDNVYP